jgi:hypothetical protein
MARHIGRGTKFSIGKAALIYYYSLPDNDLGDAFIYTGDLDAVHDIVDIAGAQHASMNTTRQVIGCINGSSFWEQHGEIQGWGNKIAHTYKPSQKGKDWYEQYKLTQENLK